MGQASAPIGQPREEKIRSRDCPPVADEVTGAAGLARGALHVIHPQQDSAAFQRHRAPQNSLP